VNGAIVAAAVFAVNRRIFASVAARDGAPGRRPTKAIAIGRALVAPSRDFELLGVLLVTALSAALLRARQMIGLSPIWFGRASCLDRSVRRADPRTRSASCSDQADADAVNSTCRVRRATRQSVG